MADRQDGLVREDQAILGADHWLSTLRARGLPLYEANSTMTNRVPDYVVVGDTRTYSFENITSAIRAVAARRLSPAERPPIIDTMSGSSQRISSDESSDVPRRVRSRADTRVRSAFSSPASRSPSNRPSARRRRDQLTNRTQAPKAATVQRGQMLPPLGAAGLPGCGAATSTAGLGGDER